MADDAAAEHPNLDHLVAAGHEMVAAARGFLDSVEGVLADPEKVSAAVGSLGTFLEDAGAAFGRFVERRVGSEPEADGSGDDDRRPSTRLRPIDVDFSDG